MILIILATIAINMIFGENGLVNRTEEAKLKQSIAEAQERLALVLADAYVEKNVNKAEYNQDEFLDEFIYEQEPGAKIFEYGEGELISLNGHAFWLDRSVPQLGKYLGPEEDLPPVITRINILDKTTSSVNIEVLTTKSDGLKYKYAIKELGQGDESYTQVKEKSENTNEFTGLQDTKKYTIKVELIKDGEVADSKVINVLIGKLEKGVVTFGDVLWQEGKASVTIHTEETGYTLQYQIGAIDDNNWIDTTSGSVIEGLEYNQTVYGRLWNKYGESAPASINIDDNIAPNVTLKVGTTTTNSIEVIVYASDTQSGLSTSETYQYYLESEGSPRETSTTNSYVFIDLSDGTNYKLKVDVKDKAGNISTKTITQSTHKKIATNINEMEVGEYVIYPSKQENIVCRVLYDNLSENGVQLISNDNVQEEIRYNGSSDYNDEVYRLNNRVTLYNNETYSSRARCVGSHPTDTSDSPGWLTWDHPFLDKWDNDYKKTDGNYSSDYNQLINLEMLDSSDNFWLASRGLETVSGLYGISDVKLSIRMIVEGKLTRGVMVLLNVQRYEYGNTAGIRPVFVMNDGIKVTGGNGTESSPYTLGV